MRILQEDIKQDHCQVDADEQRKEEARKRFEKRFMKEQEVLSANYN